MGNRDALELMYTQMIIHLKSLCKQDSILCRVIENSAASKIE